MGHGRRGGITGSIRDIFVSFGFSVDDRALTRAAQGISNISTLSVALGVSLVGASLGLRALLREAGKAEVLDVTFESLLGNAEAAKKKVDELLQFARETPFTLDGVLVNAKQLLAMNIEAEKLIPTMTILGNAAATLDVPLKQLAKNFGQVKSRGVLLGRDLNDFATAGVDVLRVIAEATGQSRAQVFENVSKRLVTFQMVEDAFKGLSEEGGLFFDVMAKRSRTFPGQMDKIMETIQLMARSIGRELLPEAKAMQIRFLEFLAVNKDIIKANILDFMGGFFKLIKISGSFVRDLGNAMLRLAGVFGMTGTAGELLLRVLTVLFGVGMVLAVKSVMNAINGLGKAFLIMGSKGFIASLFSVAPLILFGLAILDVVGHLEGMDTVTGRILKKWAKDFPETFETAKMAVNLLADEYDRVMTRLAKIVNFVVDNDLGTVLKAAVSKKTTDFLDRNFGSGAFGVLSPLLGGGVDPSAFDFSKGNEPGFITNAKKLFKIIGERGITSPGLFRSGRSPGPVTGGGSVGSVTINVTAPDGSSRSIATEVKRAVEDTIGPMLQKTNVSTAPGVR